MKIKSPHFKNRQRMCIDHLPKKIPRSQISPCQLFSFIHCQGYANQIDEILHHAQ